MILTNNANNVTWVKALLSIVVCLVLLLSSANLTLLMMARPCSFRWQLHKTRRLTARPMEMKDEHELFEKITPFHEWKHDKQQVVLLSCGSFSPITFLHLRLFEMAKDALYDADKGNFQVIGGFISPVSDHYRKEGLLEFKHRVSMCKLAVNSSNWVAVDDWEGLQSTWSLTATVLDNLQRRLDKVKKNIRVFLLAGADLVQSFAIPNLWSLEDRIKILSTYGIVVVDRWNHDISEFLLIDPILYKYRKNIHVVKQFISNDISSTKIRLFLSRDLSVKYLLPDSVIAYIKEHGLYKDSGNNV